MVALKNELCNRHLLKIEDRMREIWPDQQPKLTLLIRTPWLEDGGILLTNDDLPAALAEIDRLQKKEPFG